MEEVVQFLESLGLAAKYADKFEDEGYDDLAVIMDMNDADFDIMVQDVGLKSGHKTKIRQNIEKRKSGDSIPAPAPAPASAPAPAPAPAPAVAPAVARPVLKRKLAQGITARPKILLVTGEVGDGKSSLINHFQHATHPDDNQTLVELLPEIIREEALKSSAVAGAHQKGVTKEMSIHPAMIGMQPVFLLDTPGFGDAEVRPDEIMAQIDTFVTMLSKAGNRFFKGAAVKVHGLVGKPEYNGKVGTVERFHRKSNCIIIRLRGNKQIAVKAQNLQACLSYGLDGVLICKTSVNKVTQGVQLVLRYIDALCPSPQKWDHAFIVGTKKDAYMSNFPLETPESEIEQQFQIETVEAVTLHLQAARKRINNPDILGRPTYPKKVVLANTHRPASHNTREIAADVDALVKMVERLRELPKLKCRPIKDRVFVAHFPDLFKEVLDKQKKEEAWRVKKDQQRKDLEARERKTDAMVRNGLMAGGAVAGGAAALATATVSVVTVGTETVAAAGLAGWLGATITVATTSVSTVGGSAALSAMGASGIAAVAAPAMAAGLVVGGGGYVTYKLGKPFLKNI